MIHGVAWRGAAVQRRGGVGASSASGRSVARKKIANGTIAADSLHRNATSAARSEKSDGASPKRRLFWKRRHAHSVKKVAVMSKRPEIHANTSTPGARKRKIAAPATPPVSARASGFSPAAYAPIAPTIAPLARWIATLVAIHGRASTPLAR